MKTCLIISGGDYCTLPDSIEYDFCIACDKGLSYAIRLGITPDLIMGDFDSYKGSFDVNLANVLTFPVEKDDSDTMLAIKHAISNGYSKIIIICALGGRLDHTIANIQAMTYVATHDVACELFSETEHLITFTGHEISLPAKKGYSLSLFSLSDTCENVTIKGAGYDVENIKLTNTFPIGLSNYWKSESVSISMTTGILLICMSKHKE